MARFCIFLINLYRRYISRYTRPTCRFSPTCSTYALESYKRFGFFLGTYLTVKRLLKCHPFYKGEYFDNVPLFKRDIFRFRNKKKRRLTYSVKPSLFKAKLLCSDKNLEF